MSTDNAARHPEPWAPGERGTFVVEVGPNDERLALHCFRPRPRGTDPAGMWPIADVCALHGINPLSSPTGRIEPDGGFYFDGEVDEQSKVALVAFIEGTDPRLHLDEDVDWTFE